MTRKCDFILNLKSMRNIKINVINLINLLIYQLNMLNAYIYKGNLLCYRDRKSIQPHAHFHTT